MMYKSVFSISDDSSSLVKAKELGVDVLFVSSRNINRDYLNKIRKTLPGVRVYSEIPVFLASTPQEFPDAIPILADGCELSGTWNFLCPSNKQVRSKRLGRINELLKLSVDGVWLDFIRYPGRWEGDNPEFLDVCYCDSCLDGFQKVIGALLPRSHISETSSFIRKNYLREWYDYRVEVISSFVREVKGLVGAVNDHVDLGLFTVPFTSNDYDNAVLRVYAQDHKALGGVVDVVSPMVYHRMTNNPVSWIGNMVNYFSSFSPRVLPLVQSENRLSEFGPEEFSQSLSLASHIPSLGVCVFHLEDLVKQPEKFSTFRSFSSP